MDINDFFGKTSWLQIFALVFLLGCQSSRNIDEVSAFPGQCRLVSELSGELGYRCHDGQSGAIGYKSDIRLSSPKPGQSVVFYQSDISKVAQGLALLEKLLREGGPVFLLDGTPIPREAEGYQERAKLIFIGFDDQDVIVKFDMGSHAVVFRESKSKRLTVDYHIY